MPPPSLTEITVGRAARALRLENDLLSTTIALDQGADLLTLTYKPRAADVLFKVPRPPREHAVGSGPTGDSFAQWLAYYPGGWQTIFPNFGPANDYQGATLDFHGEAARVPWQVVSVENDNDALALTLGVTLHKCPFRMERALTLRAGSPALAIKETITNTGVDPTACMWGHHPAIGAPFLSPDCFIDTGAQSIESDDGYLVPGNDLPLGQTWAWPHVTDKQGRPVDLSRIPPPDHGHSRVLWLKDFREAWYAITNPTLGFGVGLAWDGAVFPYAAFWQETGGTRDHPWYGAAYVTAIEPQASYPAHGLTKVMQKNGTHLTVAPGESRTVDMLAVFYEGKQRVTGIDLAGNVLRS
jgi:galactose mutarotase-like enzyme